jgi:hypothetical protein
MTGDEYLRTAKALARETSMADPSVRRIEEQLLRAMSLPPSASLWLPPLGGRNWLVTAAAVILIAGSIALWRVSRGTVDTLSRPEHAALEEPSTPPEVAPEFAPKATVLKNAKAPQQSRGHRPAHRTEPARVVSPSGFVELPWSAGLPAFESGEIVRLEVPVASLAAYGVDISSGADRPVEADILIGQDGFARAIRLVTNSARSVQ